MLDDSVHFHKRATEAGAADMHLSVYPRMWHDWVMYEEACHQGGGETLRAATRGLEEMASFVKRFT